MHQKRSNTGMTSAPLTASSVASRDFAKGCLCWVSLSKMQTYLLVIRTSTVNGLCLVTCLGQTLTLTNGLNELC